MAACKKDDKKSDNTPAPPQLQLPNLPIGGYKISTLQLFTLKADAIATGTVTYAWTLNGDTLSTDQTFSYVFSTPGTYLVNVSATANNATARDYVTITVTQRTATTGVAHVYAFMPAPGQFTNAYPTYEEGDNDSTMAAKAEAQLKSNGLISLGAYGGYVIFGFDHTVQNIEGQDNFIVEGNAFSSWSEAGIVMVSADVNGNGKADDEWYELAGSEYNKPATIHNYQVTYYKPDENKVPTPDDAYQADTTYIRWKDNQGKTGYVSRNIFNTGVYWPKWISKDSITFTGSKLSSAGVQDMSGSGTYWVSPAFDWGYTDNLTNDDPHTPMRISWAVDKDGKPVHLAGIDFVKVYTAMNASAGWLGEISTEVTQARDLNLK